MPILLLFFDKFSPECGPPCVARQAHIGGEHPAGLGDSEELKEFHLNSEIYQFKIQLIQSLRGLGIMEIQLFLCFAEKCKNEQKTNQKRLKGYFFHLTTLFGCGLNMARIQNLLGEEA